MPQSPPPRLEMLVIGFPSSRGQMPVVAMTGFGVGVNAKHRDDAMAALDVMASAPPPLYRSAYA